MSGAETADGALRLRLLEKEACLEAKPLWREVFCEDTERFTDYYFSHKAPKNRGLVLEGADGIRSMLYLTPEHVKLGAQEVCSAYIVGVATGAKYRHRGYMAALLKETFRMLYRERTPFVFLMPAAPDIYMPFDFTYIYKKPLWDVSSLKKEKLTVLKEQDIGRMAAFAQDFLEREKAVYIRRDAAYYRLQLLELAAQEGCIYGYEEPQGGILKGLCMYAGEGDCPEILEVLADRATEEEFVERKKGCEPAVMARIVSVKTMLSMMRSEEPLSFVLAVKDPLIAENNGSFFCETGADGTKATACVRRETPDAEFSVADLAAVLFGYRPAKDGVFGKIHPFSPVWINEIV